MPVASLLISTTHTTTLPHSDVFPTTVLMPLQMPIHHNFIQQPPSQLHWNWNSMAPNWMNPYLMHTTFCCESYRIHIEMKIFGRPSHTKECQALQEQKKMRYI